MATPAVNETKHLFTDEPRVNPVVWYILGVAVAVFLIWYFAIKDLDVIVPATTTTYEVKPRGTETEVDTAPAQRQVTPPPPSEAPRGD
jgi:hypothetical protein